LWPGNAGIAAKPRACGVQPLCEPLVLFDALVGQPVRTEQGVEQEPEPRGDEHHEKPDQSGLRPVAADDDQQHDDANKPVSGFMDCRDYVENGSHHEVLRCVDAVTGAIRISF